MAKGATKQAITDLDNMALSSDGWMPPGNLALQPTPK
jgi:hypothetical protein